MRRLLGAPGALLAGVLVLLALVVVGAATGPAWQLGGTAPSLAPVSPPPVAQAPPPTLPPVTPHPGEGAALGRWLAGILVAVAAVAIFFLVRAVVRRIRAWERAPVEPPADGGALAPGALLAGNLVDVPVLADAVDLALARLDAATTPHDAVVAAWVALEDAATRHGWERQPYETSTEFAGRLLDVSPAPSRHTATLRRLYQHARFTTHPVTSDQVAQARTALEAIARALEGKAR
ncbi:MAG: DUF4129 domain-containing protein [Promicromonosporaceae bacterium]|nr:DUF4129 domain-containing protein [Promicromonosporaceae bacterium]